MPTVYPIVPNYTYTDREWIESLLSEEGLDLRLDDDADAIISEAEEAVMTPTENDEGQTVKGQIINTATEMINFYLAPRYKPVDLHKSYFVWQACTVFAARHLCMRRMNPPPESIEMLYEETKEILKMIQDGKAQVPRVKTRKQPWMAWSNVEVDFRYYLRKLRTQNAISDPSANDNNYRQSRSRWSEGYHEF